MCSADLLILLSDINGLYSSDPNKNNNTVLIEEIHEITDEIETMAGPPHHYHMHLDKNLNAACHPLPLALLNQFQPRKPQTLDHRHHYQ